MDQLHIEIVFEPHPSQPEGKLWLAVQGHVNGNLVANWAHLPLDLDALKASSVVEGDYYLWNCSCGHPACAGLYKPITVVHAATTISWLGSPAPIDQLPDLHFERRAYLEEVSRAMKQMKTQAHLARVQGEPFEFALRDEEELFWRKEDRGAMTGALDRKVDLGKKKARKGRR